MHTRVWRIRVMTLLTFYLSSSIHLSIHHPPADLDTEAMADIQNIVVTSTQIVTQPKPHTTYTIQG